MKRQRSGSLQRISCWKHSAGFVSCRFLICPLACKCAHASKLSGDALFYAKRLQSICKTLVLPGSHHPLLRVKCEPEPGRDIPLRAAQRGHKVPLILHECRAQKVRMQLPLRI